MSMEKIIASGNSKEAFSLDENIVRLILKFKVEDNELRGLFLLQKIAHLLFPENVPSPETMGRNEHGEGYIDVVRAGPDAYLEYVQSVRNAKGTPYSPASDNLHEIQYYKRLHSDPETKAREQAFLDSMRRAGFKDVENLQKKNVSHHEGKLTYYDFGVPRPGITFTPKLLKKAIDSIQEEKVRNEARALYKELMLVTSTGLSKILTKMLP